MAKGGAPRLFKLEIVDEIETDELTTNMQIPQDNMALHVPLEQSLPEVCFDCLLQFCPVICLQQVAFP